MSADTLPPPQRLPAALAGLAREPMAWLLVMIPAAAAVQGVKAPALWVFAVFATVLIYALVTHDGESNWMEGVMLLGLYAMLALAFYHLPQLHGVS